MNCGRPMSASPTERSGYDRNESPSSSSDIIRYSRDDLLGLRNSTLSLQKPNCIDDRLWLPRLWNSEKSNGFFNVDSRGLSASSSTSSLANSSSNYLLPSFACKRRSVGPSVTSSGSGCSKDRSVSGQMSGLRRGPSESSPSTRRGGDSSSNNNGERRIGSGRIPVRGEDAWMNDYDRDNTSSPISKPSAVSSSGSTPSASSSAQNTDGEYNFRPSGGLLGLRDRDRGNDTQQTSSSSSSSNVLNAMLQQHSILPRGLIDKERHDYRNESRSNMLNDDRYERRSYGMMDNKDRNMRGGNDSRMSNSRDHHREHSGRSHSYNQSNQYGNNDYRGGRRTYESRSHVMEEPEWFSGGPTSQNDVIELRGFDDPATTEKKSPKHSHRLGSDGSNDADALDTDRIAAGGSKSSRDNRNIASNDSNNNSSNKNDKIKNSNRSDNKSDTDMKKFDANENANNRKEEDNFNFEDFLKLDSITDLLVVSTINWNW